MTSYRHGSTALGEVCKCLTPAMAQAGANYIFR
jgi:hypothetical protein